MRLVTAYEPLLLAVALLVGSVGSYVAFDLARRAAAASGRARLAWLTGASAGTGIAIWSVGLIVMLATELAVPVLYQIDVVVLAMVVPVVGALPALALVYRRPSREWHFPVGAGLLVIAAELSDGVSLRAAHDVVASEHGEALFGPSFWVLMPGALAALLLARWLPGPRFRHPLRRQLGAAVVMSATLVLGRLAELETAVVPPSAVIGAPAPPQIGPMAVGALIAIAALLLFAATLIGARAHERLSVQATALLTGAEVAREVSASPDAREAVCTGACRVSGANFSMLFEPDGQGNLVTTATWGRERLPTARIAIGEEPSGAAVAFTSKQRFVALDARSDQAVSRRLVEDHGVGAALFEPVLRDGETVGVLVVAWSQPLRRIPDDVTLVTGLLAAEAATAIRQADLLAQFAALAGTDPLTGLPNRRTWEEELPRQLARAGRESRPLSIALIDLDHFKRFNDERGHQDGDRLLKESAAAWLGALREGDLLARFGGEEFVAILPGVGVEEACRAIERLRAATAGEQTCSSGVACWDGSESLDGLLARADRALYAAKHAGRDRTVAASFEPA